jgi:hypothetical protein
MCFATAFARILKKKYAKSRQGETLKCRSPCMASANLLKLFLYTAEIAVRRIILVKSCAHFKNFHMYIWVGAQANAGVARSVIC